MIYISILNYSTGEVDILHIDEESIEDIEDYLVSIGYRLNEISYMVSDALNIKMK